MIKKIGDLAIESMLMEVSITPKPGLVDRNNSGSHSDMNFFTFIKSISALRSYFENFALIGYENSGDLKTSWPALRALGIEAENKMFKATNGINTHKGEIFSLGLLSACAGKIYFETEKFNVIKILDLVKNICEGLCDRDFKGVEAKKILTKGERAYLNYGIKGVRGEAEAGYPIVLECLGIFKNLLSREFDLKLNLNDALAMTLLKVIALNNDSNIISRHDIKILNYAKSSAEKIFNELQNNFDVNLIYALDQDFISRNISPSGSADLLAVIYFMYALENL